MILNVPMNMCILPQSVSLIRNPSATQFHDPPNLKAWGRPRIPKKAAEMHLVNS